MLHASAAIVLLLVNTVLSVYKPRGMTAYGRAKQAARTKSEPPVAISDFYAGPSGDGASTTGTPRWIYVIAIHAIGLVLLFLLLHLTGAPRLGH